MDAKAKREAAGYHEAGHAVIGIQLGATLRSVQFDGEGIGQCIFNRNTLIHENEIRIAMAGPAAEYMYCHSAEKVFSLDNCNASAKDLKDVDDYCESFRPEQRQHVKDEHWAATCQMLLSNWPSVHRVAARLIEHEGPYLLGTAITELIE